MYLERSSSRTPSAFARLHPTTEGSALSTSGTVSLSEDPATGVVTIALEARGLEAGSMHGFHIHAYGDASDASGLAMGGHFNPTNAPHGCSPTPNLISPSTHYGDLGSITADTTGRVSTTWTSSSLSLSDPTNPGFLLGRGFILHSQKDDCTTQPTGNAGARLAQGVVAFPSSHIPTNHDSGKDSTTDAIAVFRQHVRGQVVATTQTETLVLSLDLDGLAFGETYRLGLGVFEYDTNNHFASKSDCTSALTTFQVDSHGSIHCHTLLPDSKSSIQSLYGLSFLLMDGTADCDKDVAIIAASPIGVKARDEKDASLLGETCRRVDSSRVTSDKASIFVEGGERMALLAVCLLILLFVAASCWRKGSGYKKVEEGKAE
ncbi:hypothetical protein HDU98_001857 [Podochytrium sp. JEL0797]|nr:hypothetical protein HDU98_001857 [Podochytrium sp. JEL0797]